MGEYAERQAASQDACGSMAIVSMIGVFLHPACVVQEPAAGDARLW